jgi:hypothetical protein
MPILAASHAFAEKFDLEPFAFGHALADHPLFSIDRLVRLSAAMLARGAADSFMHVDGTAWPEGSFHAAVRERSADVARHLERPGTWIKLTSPQEVDDDYRRFVDDLVAELEQRTGRPLRQEISWLSPTIFLAGAHTRTPFHIDHEVTFLFLIQGTKEVSLFDRHDRELLAETDIERYYAGDSAAARWRDENANKARVFRLEPGQGVHHPNLAPHAVRNGDSPTISMSLNFCLRALDRRSRIYQVNHYLRRLGLRPKPPGVDPVGDAAKIGMLGLASSRRQPRTSREAFGSGLDRLRSLVRVPRAIRPRTPSAIQR